MARPARSAASAAPPGSATGWAAGARSVCHIDFHTGLGAWGSYRLLVEPGLDWNSIARLRRTYGDDRVEVAASLAVFGTACPLLLDITGTLHLRAARCRVRCGQ